MKIIQLLGGYLHLKKYCKRSGENVSYVFTNMTLRDMCFELAWISTYKKKNELDKVILITADIYKPLVELYVHILDQIIYVSKKRMDKILLFSTSDIGHLYRRRNKRVFCVYSLANVREKLLHNPTELTFARVTKLIYHIPLDAEPDYITIPSSIESGKNLYENHILIIPFYEDGNVLVPIQERFFENMLQVIEQFCMLSSHKSIVRMLRIPHKSILNVAWIINEIDKADYIIGPSSGVLDLAILLKKNVVALTMDKEGYSDYYNIEAWKNIYGSKSFIYKKNEELKLINKILEYLKNI